MDNLRHVSRRDFLQGAKRWSSAVVTLALAGMMGEAASGQASWVNRYGGGWVNGAGGWVNRSGWINGAGGWVNRGGSWGNGSAGSWVNRYGGAGWINGR